MNMGHIIINRILCEVFEIKEYFNLTFPRTCFHDFESRPNNKRAVLLFYLKTDSVHRDL